VIAIDEKAHGLDDPGLTKRLNNLAELYREWGKPAEAESLYKRVIAIGDKASGWNDLELAKALDNLAELYRTQGKPAEAEQLYKRVIAIKEKRSEVEYPELAKALNNLAEFYRAQGKPAEAEPLYKRAIAIIEEVLEVANSNAVVASADINLRLLRSIYALDRPANLNAAAAVYENYAALLHDMNRAAEAAKLKARAAEIRAKTASKKQN
jgi:tetratricopeptide (TPR) repeat protein